MIPLAGRDKLNDAQNMVTDVGLESSRVPFQPAKNNSTICPGRDILDVEVKFTWKRS